MTSLRGGLIGVALASLLVASPAAAQTANRILVMPFENVARDSRIVWLGEAAAVLLAEDLNALGARAITREERRDAFGQLQIPTSAPLSDATMIRIAQMVGASRVVLGTLQREGETLVVRARAIVLETARVQVSSVERAPIAELFPLFQRVAARIQPEAVSQSPAAPPIYPSVTAFENYIKGLLAETPATALSYLNASLQAQAGFDRARLAIWEVHAEQGDHERALAAVARIPPTSDVYRRARFMAGLSQLNLQRHQEAFDTFRSLADGRATAAILNNLGVVQVRRGGTPQTGLPTYYFNKAAEADATDPDYFFNLGYAYWAERDFVTAAYWLREAVRRDPADGDAHYVLGASLTASGNNAEANREKELARRLSSTYAEWEQRPASEVVPKGLERVKLDADVLRIDRLEASIASAGLRDQQELARFYLDRGRRLYEQERDREAVAELNRALFLSPYEAEAHLLIGRMHLRAGRTREAIDALKISLWSAETADAHAVLAQAYLETGRLDEARTEGVRALAMNPSLASAAAVLEKLKR